MTASRDDLLDAAAIVRSIALSDDEAIQVVLDNSDNRAVAVLLARWCAGWLLDAAKLGHRDEAWWHTELLSWASKDLPGDWPWKVP